MDYVALHASLLQRLKKLGTAVTVGSADSGAVYNPSTDSWTGGAVNDIPGFAVEVPGDPEEYQTLELITAQPATLLFVPVTFDSTPALGMGVTWAGTARTVRAVRPIRPDGRFVGGRLLLA